MEEMEIFLNAAVKSKNLVAILNICSRAGKGSYIKKKAAEEYLDLCSGPVELWALRSIHDIDEEYKEEADRRIKECSGNHSTKKKVSTNLVDA